MKSLEELSLSELEHLEALCGQLTGAKNRVSEIETLLNERQGPTRALFLKELIWQDLEDRQLRGEQPNFREYQFSDSDDAKAANEVWREFEAEEVSGSNSSESSHGLPERYRWVEEVGRGGIGVVWKVFDRHSQRPLAIKVLRTKFRSVRQANLRLQREAILTGMLQHPGVPAVHDHGSLDDQSLYFSMKLIEGETLADILNRGKRPAASESLNIFHNVVETMAYVHSQGVIHRDLKPENIMVGQFSEVQVMDWGMAKRLDEQGLPTDASNGLVDRQWLESEAATETVAKKQDSSIDNQRELTRLGDVMGTPSFMSPEQAQGDLTKVGSASDVFGLGAILFEILTGERIHSGKPASDVLKRIAEGDLGDVWQRLDACNADVEIVDLCRNCLAPKISDRMPDATGVAAGLREYFDSVQDRARSAEMELQAANVRTAEEIKRRQTFTRMALLTAMAVCLGVAGIIWQWRNASQARALAEQNATESEASAKLANETADQYRAGMSVFTGAFKSANPNAGADAKTSAADVLIAAHRGLAGSGLDDEGKMAMLRELTLAFRAIGEYEIAIEAAEESVELHEKNYGIDDDVTIDARNGLAIIYSKAGRSAEALELDELNLKLSEETLGKDHESTLSVGNNVANSYYACGRYEDSIALHQEILKRRREKFGAMHIATASSMDNLAQVYNRVGKYSEALKMSQHAIEVKSKELGEKHPTTLLSMSNLAGLYDRCGQFEKAYQLGRESLKLHVEKFGDQHPGSLRSMNNLALTLGHLGKTEEALEMQLELLDLQTAKLDKDHPWNLSLMTTIATNYNVLQRFEESLALHQQTLKLKQAKLGDWHPDTLKTLHNIADCYNNLERIDEAIDLYETTLQHQRAELGETAPDTLRTMVHLAVIYADKKEDYGKAKQVFEECVKIQLRLDPSWRTHDAQSRLGAVLMELGETERAEDELVNGITGLERLADTIPQTFRVDRLEAALARIARFYSAREEPDALKQWQRRIANVLGRE